MTSTPRFKQAVANFVTIFGLIFLVGCSSSEERAENHYKRGLELVEEGELTKASLEFRNALKLKSDHVDALFAFGEIQEQQGEIQSAFRIYNSVAEQSEGHVPARLKLVYMLLAANQAEHARKFLDEALAIAADAPEVVVAKATLELRSGNPDEAERLANEAIKQNADLEDAYIVLASARLLSDDPAGAVAILEKAPESGLDNVGLQVLKISALDSLGDDVKIEAQMAEMVKRFPDKPQFGIAWAQWYMSKDRPADAERVMRQLAKDKQDDDAAQMRLVSFVLSQKGQDAARNELETLIEARKEGGGDPHPLQAALTQLNFSTGNEQQAIDYMQSVLAEATGTEEKTRARLLLAAMLFETGEIEQSEAYVSETLDVDSKNVEALRLRAAIKLSNSDNAGAADDILVALNEAPNDARLRLLLAEAHERNGSSILAEEEFAKAFALDNQSATAGLPMVRYLFRHGKAEQAERILEAIREQDPTNHEVLSLLAQQKLAKRDFVGAQQIAELLRNSDNQNNARFADKITAAALGGQQKHEENLDFLEESMASSKENQELLPELVRAYVRSGQQEKALERLQSELESAPDNVQARLLLGAVHMSNGERDKAEEAFKLAAADNSDASGDTALAQFYLASSQPQKAEEAILAGLEKDEASTALQLMLTTVLQRMERFDEAIAVYEKMFEADPSSTIVANDLASLLSERRGDEASLERALEIAQRFRTSEVPQYKDTLGWIYYLKNDYSSALPLLRASAEGLSNMGLAQYHYGMTLAALDQTQDAIDVLERALVLKTLMTEEDQELARQTLERLKQPRPAAETE
ncbi:tetratricopeptide repeat protein [Roseibium sp. MMSF_3412]|uniref:tetratricopeptide repeat protein n=1 Tax=Roseibium sp. MMSF_3412 TaxID=3046712 RepID=UPI00273FE5AA|nr:tetratricopeptide repeat protein [Roseibium sp. MMSF_3412]